MRIVNIKDIGVVVAAFFVSAAWFNLSNAQISMPQGSKIVDPFFTPERAEEFPKDHIPIEEKTPGAVIFSTNFANNLGSWTNSGPDGALWLHDDDGPNGQFSVASLEIIASQSVNNGFAIFDADLSNPGPGPWQARSGALVSPSFAMTGIAYAFVEFTHKYRFCCNDLFFPKLEISNNNFQTYASFDASIPGVESNSISPTNITKINISTFLDTATNLASVKIRFNFDGVPGGSHYYWQIDDVRVKEAFLYDLNEYYAEMGMGAMQLPYYFMPISQISPITFRAIAKNDGALPAENARLKVSLDLSGGTAFSPAIPLMDPLLVDTFTTDGLTVPSVWNYYTVSYTMEQDSAESYPNDNTLTEYLSVFDHVFSLDDNQPTGYISNVDTQVGQPLKIGNVMEILQPDQIDSMFIFVTATSTNIGQLVYGELRKRVNGSWVLAGTTNSVAINADNNGQDVGLRFQNVINVNSGDTVLVLACHNGGSPDVRFRITQKVDPGIVQGYLADGTLFTLNDPNAIMVRLNVGNFVGITELNEVALSVYPNPVSEEITLRGTGGISGSVKIMDYTGKVVLSKQILANENVLNVRSLAPGMYTIWYAGPEGQSSCRFVKQ